MSRSTWRPEVVVASDLTLVAEAVRAGLADRDFSTIAVAWPGEHEVMPPEQSRCCGRDVGLLISDLDSWSRLQAASLLIRQVPLPWVVLTGVPRGPMWGALLKAGAWVVLPSTTRLKAVCRAVAGAARGTVEMLPTERDGLIDLWTELLERREVIGQRVLSLTPREHEVLTMLHAGDPVARIAQLLDVSPATVRSQVKAVLRKLEVKTQLGAVAALDDLLELEPMAQEELQV